MQLTTSSGRNIGSICVLDTKSKTISKSQKEQLQRLADLIINHLESESRYNNLSTRFKNQKDTLRKLNHDVRSPINGILGITETLETTTKINFTVPGQDIKLIKQAAKAIIDKIDGVLSNMETNGQDENKTTLRKTLNKIDNLYRPLAEGKQQNLSFENNAESPIVIPEYLSIKLTQIIGNLVANAIKFTPKQGNIKVTVGQQENGNRKTLP
ncbi:MAG: hypothetical protein U5J63_01920 [Fodinibius sp.]|nr:hypothetical protein [Fodinibius sp.]